jgi:hypothetical protein
MALVDARTTVGKAQEVSPLLTRPDVATEMW